jgi:Fe-S-cluster containining protein
MERSRSTPGIEAREALSWLDPRRPPARETVNVPDDAPPTRLELIDLVRSIARDVRGTLAGELGDSSIAGLIDDASALASTLSETLDAKVASEHRRLPVCKSGCDTCCRIHAVFVTPLEAIRIGQFLRESLDAEALAVLTARVDEVAETTAGMTLAERGTSRTPCPLLDEKGGACTVYPVRPLLCRGYNSCDVSSCLHAYETGDNETPPPGNASQGAAHATAFAGLMLGSALHREDASPLELIVALRAVLHADDAEPRWKAGEAIFEGADSRITRERGPAWLAWLARERAELL